MHVFTDSKVALRDAVTRPSKRLSSWEILDATEKHRILKAELDRRLDRRHRRPVCGITARAAGTRNLVAYGMPFADLFSSLKSASSTS